jgi:hypothetical protein
VVCRHIGRCRIRDRIGSELAGLLRITAVQQVVVVGDNRISMEYALRWLVHINASDPT